MKYDKKKYEIEFDKLRYKDTIFYDLETDELSHMTDSAEFGEAPKEEKLPPGESEYLKTMELTETEQELGEEQNKAWEDLRVKTFKCLDLYVDGNEYKFFEAFGDVCLSLNELWRSAIFDFAIQCSIIHFLEAIDQKRYDKIQNELWFCMYNKTGRDEYAHEDLLIRIMMMDNAFPYPGYIEEQIDKYIAEAKKKGGAYWDRVKMLFESFI